MGGFGGDRRCSVVGRREWGRMTGNRYQRLPRWSDQWIGRGYHWGKIGQYTSQTRLIVSCYPHRTSQLSHTIIRELQSPDIVRHTRQRTSNQLIDIQTMFQRPKRTPRSPSTSSVNLWCIGISAKKIDDFGICDRIERIEGLNKQEIL
jgi:hypothetical protein